MDAEEFSRLVPPQMEAVLRLALALVGPTDAEDMAQEAAVRAWQAWPTLRERDAVRSWLLRITANTCYTWRKSRHSTTFSHQQSLGDKDDVNAIVGAATLDPGSVLHADVLDLQAAIDALAEDLRVVIALRYFGGFESHEIGEIIGIPASTVRSRQARALAQIRAALAPTSSQSPSKEINR